MNKAQELLNKFNDKKTLPHVAIRVNQLAKNDNTSMKDLEEIIRLDPILVTRLLGLVNSAFFGLRERVESISKAVVFVGFNQLRNLVAVEGLKDLFTDKTDESGFSRKQIWFHSAVVAILSGMIATRVFGKNADDYFLCGILHDIGIIVEEQVEGDLLRQVCHEHQRGDKSFLDLEREIIGTDHCEIGATLATTLDFPKGIVNAIKRHHDTIEDLPFDSICGTIQLSNLISEKMKHAAIEGITEKINPALLQHISKKKNDYRLIFKALPKEMEKAKELFEIGE